MSIGSWFANKTHVTCLLKRSLHALKQEGFSHKRVSLRVMQQISAVAQTPPEKISLKYAYVIYPKQLSYTDAFKQASLYLLEYNNIFLKGFSGLVVRRIGHQNRIFQITKVDDALQAITALREDIIF